MAIIFDFVDEDSMSELSNAANKIIVAQRTGGFGSDLPTLSKAVNSKVTADTNTGGDIFPRQPLIASMGVSIGGNTVDIEQLKGGADMPKTAQGSFTVGGDIICNIPIRNGMELIHRNITQDRNPAAKYHGGTTYPSEWEIVAESDANDDEATHTHTAKPSAIKNEVNPNVVISNSPSIASGAIEAVVTIEGTDRNGVAISRITSWTASDLTTTTKVAGGFFKTITAVKSKGFGAGKVEVNATDLATELTFTPYDSEIVDYFDIEVGIGNLVPFSFYGGVINTVAFSMSRDEVVQYTLGTLFGNVGIRKSLSNGTSPTAFPSGVNTPVPEVYVGTQCEVEVAGTSVPLDSATVNLNQSYIPSPYIGKTLWPKKPRRNAYRSISLSLTFPATSQNNWLQYFQTHATFEDVIVRMQSGVVGTTGQFGGSVEWHFEKLVLAEAPTIATAGQDTAIQTANLVAFSDTESAAFSIKSVTEKYGATEQLYRYI